MELLGRNRWTSESPEININYYYEHQRSGSNMQYRVKVSVEPVTGQRYFGYPIYVKVNMDGADKVTQTLKGNSPSQWSSNIEWTSDWYTINNKTSGTTSLSFNVYSGNGSSRNVTYNYSMAVDPAYTTVSTWTVASKTETSIILNWATAHTCSQIRYGTSTSSYTTANVNASSGSVTISGLSANTSYTLYFMPCRKDSSLWGNGSANTWKSLASQSTYNWPNCTSAPNFTIGNSVTLQFYNPLNRTFAIRMWSHSASAFVSDSINISGTSYTFTPNANTLYASIPNTKSSVYNIDCTYNNHKLVKAGGSYSINESTNKPIFSNFTYADTNATTTALTGNNQIVVQGYSNVTATVSTSNKASAQNSATMKKYNLVIGTATNSVNYSETEDVSVTINNAQNGTITLYAEDSRGLTTPVVKNANVKAYTNIAKSEISISRQNNVGEAVTLEFNGTFWNDNFGNTNNAITNVTYRFKKTTDTNWTTGTTSITPTISDNNYSFSGGIIGDIAGTGFDASNSYNIEVTVSDRLSSTTFTATLGSGSPNMAFVKNGVSLLGKYNENDTTNKVQINGATKISGNTNISGTLATTGNGSIGGTLTVGSFERNTTATWMPVIQNGRLDYTQRKIINSKTHTDYNNNQDYLPTMSFLSYWNGAYNSSNASNLTYAHQGTIWCKPINLYNNTSGTTGTINLSQSSANFSFIEIFYKKKNGYTNADTYHSVKIFSPNGKKACLIWGAVETSSIIQLMYSTKNISGTSFTHNYGGYINAQGSSVGLNTNSNEIYVVRIDGYK